MLVFLQEETYFIRTQCSVTNKVYWLPLYYFLLLFWQLIDFIGHHESLQVQNLHNKKMTIRIKMVIFNDYLAGGSMVKATLPFFISTESTQTVTTSPTDTISNGCFTKRLLSLEI